MKRDIPVIGLSLLIWAAALLCAAGNLTAQAPPPTQSSAPAIRSTTRLVQVNVIVERKGKPVTGLTKDDFTITDQNQPQQIASFTEVKNEPGAEVKVSANPPTSAPSPTTGPMNGAGDAGGAASNTFSNRPSVEAGAPSTVTVILLDALNTSFQELGNAREEIKNFLRQIQPHDRVALYGLSSQLFVIHGFTSDAASLLKALDKTKTGNVYNPSAPDVTPAQSGDDDVDAFINASNQHAADLATLNRAEFTANVIAAIANSVAAIPGRKNLVWVSGGFPLKIGTGTIKDDPQGRNGPGAPGPSNSVAYRSFQKEIEAAAEAVNNANLAIYPVDARGLIGASNFSAAVQSRTPTNQNRRRPLAVQQVAPPRDNFDAMNELADRTGGRAFYNANDIQGSIRRAIDDSRDTYVLEYYPTGVEWDGTFHAIKVGVKQSGVSVRSRSGYFALPDPAADPMRVEQMVQDALASPFEDSELGIAVDASDAGTNTTGARRINLQVRVDPARVRFHLADGKWLDDIEIICAQYSADGKPITGNKQTVNVSLTQVEYEESLRTAVKVARGVSIRDGAVKLRVVVHDIGSGSVGSVDVPIASILASGK
jgi:VWFA-related protein